MKLIVMWDKNKTRSAWAYRKVKQMIENMAFDEGVPVRILNYGHAFRTIQSAKVQYETFFSYMLAEVKGDGASLAQKLREEGYTVLLEVKGYREVNI